LQAFATKIGNNAHNIANMNTEKFKKDSVILSSQSPQGVRATVLPAEAPGSVVAELSDQGSEMVEQSNVDLGEELPDLILTAHSYRANLKTLQTADQMVQSLLDTKV
jgi:flagellar basal-body rod protein FlgC